MTKATSRLRRAGVAGLATATVAGLVIASAGSAFATFTGAAGTVTLATGSSATTVYPGVATQALPNVNVTLTDGSWAAGDFLTIGFSSSGTALTPVCNTSSNLNASAAWGATPTYTATDNGGAAVGAATITPESSANCSVHDEFQFALPSASTDTGQTTFSFTGLSATLGTAIPAGALYLTATASNGGGTSPFTGSHGTLGVQVATIGTESITATSIGVAPSSVDVTMPTISVTDVLGGQIATGLGFALPTGDSWATLPTLVPPTGVTASTSSVAGGTTVIFALTGTTPANGVYTLSGGEISFSATAGAVLVTVKTGTGGTTTTVGTVQVAFVGNQDRVGGADRYATAMLLFDEQFGTATPSTGVTPAFTAPAFATSVVVTSGANYPDALSSAYLAASLSTGILLTDPNTLSISTQQVLTNGHITTVYIVGGTSAVSQNVQNQIAALKNPTTTFALNVIRVAGADRYATNEAADLNAGVVGAGTTNAIIATGTNFADALAASPAIAKLHWPLILTTPNSLSPSAAATIAALGVKNVVILGGTSAVSAAVETAIKALPGGVGVSYRIAGADRTLTAEQIATWETQGLAASGAYSALGSVGFAFGSTGNADISNGANFPDALAAGPVLAKAGAGAAGEVLLLTTSPTALGAGIPAYLAGEHAHVATVSAIGLASAVSPTVLAAAGGSIS